MANERSSSQLVGSAQLGSVGGVGSNIMVSNSKLCSYVVIGDELTVLGNACSRFGRQAHHSRARSAGPLDDGIARRSPITCIRVKGTDRHHRVMDSSRWLR